MKKVFRNARLAAVFAALFILTLLISISFITIVAILSDGFSTLISGIPVSSGHVAGVLVLALQYYTNPSPHYPTSIPRL